MRGVENAGSPSCWTTARGPGPSPCGNTRRRPAWSPRWGKPTTMALGFGFGERIAGVFVGEWADAPPTAT